MEDLATFRAKEIKNATAKEREDSFAEVQCKSMEIKNQPNELFGN